MAGVIQFGQLSEAPRPIFGGDQLPQRPQIDPGLQFLPLELKVAQFGNDLVPRLTGADEGSGDIDNLIARHGVFFAFGIEDMMHPPAGHHQYADSRLPQLQEFHHAPRGQSLAVQIVIALDHLPAIFRIYRRRAQLPGPHLHPLHLSGCLYHHPLQTGKAPAYPCALRCNRNKQV